MLELTRVSAAGGGTLCAKLEFLNPGMWVKDRIGIGVVERAAAHGELQPGGTIIEPTAGNTGIGLALAGVRMGYKVILCVPENFSEEKREVMKALGGTLVLTPKDDGMKGAIANAHELAKTTPNAYVPQQFANPYHTAPHYHTTAPPIYDQFAVP